MTQNVISQNNFYYDIEVLARSTHVETNLICGLQIRYMLGNWKIFKSNRSEFIWMLPGFLHGRSHRNGWEVSDD